MRYVGMDKFVKKFIFETVTGVEMYAHFKMSRMWLKYHPSGTVGTRSPPAKSKMGARGPQNG